MKTFLLIICAFALIIGVVSVLPDAGKKIREGENFFKNPQKSKADRKISNEAKKLTSHEKNEVLVNALKPSDQKLLLDTAIQNGYENPLEMYLSK